MKPEDEKTEVEKLEEQIIELKSKIKNTEYDLEQMFKGNALIQQKLSNAKKSIEEKQKLFDNLSKATTSGEYGTEEPEISELSEDKFEAPVIAQDQQKKIDLEIEKEFL